MTFETHPLRGQVLGEVHARPFAGMAPPRRILHFAFMTDAELAQADRKAFAAFCETRGHRGPDARAKYHRLDLGDCALRWEQHAEFTTYSWSFLSTDRSPFETAASQYERMMRALPQPGPHLVSADLHYVSESNAGPWRGVFDASSLAACRTGEGKALAATDFHVTADGYVRILVLGRKLEPLRAGSLILQLLELETYRSLSLLGLPLAQSLQSVIRDQERELAAITTEMTSTSGLEANRPLLTRLMKLAGELEAGASQAQFRFGATTAYYQIVRARIAELMEQRIASLQTISGFMERRLAPAMRTCASIELRQEKLSNKLARTADLLRTRVDIELEQQNAELLAAMNRRARQQLRLQKTVEGLSIAAISYYVVQLMLYLAGPLLREGESSAKWSKAAIAAIAIVAVAVAVRSIRKRHSKD